MARNVVLFEYHSIITASYSCPKSIVFHPDEVQMYQTVIRLLCCAGPSLLKVINPDNKANCFMVHSIIVKLC